MTPGEKGKSEKVMNENLTIETFSGKDGFLSIRDHWESILSGMGEGRRYFHLYEWFKSYLDTLEANPAQVDFHVVFRDAIPVAIFPSCIVSGQLGVIPARLLDIPPSPHYGHTPLSDFLCEQNNRNGMLLSYLIGYLRRSRQFDWDCLRLTRILSDSNALFCLGEMSPNLVIREAAGQSNYLQYASYEQFLQIISKNFRGNLRKARNKLAKLDGVRQLCVRDKDQLPAALRIFLDLEASGWKGQGGIASAIKLNPRIESFYNALIENIENDGNCEIDLLMVGEECIAALFCIQVGYTLYALKIAYNETFSSLSPGNMLMDNLIRRCDAGDHGIKIINLVSDAQWHTDWIPHAYDVYNVWIFNNSPKGLSMFAAMKLKKSLRNAYQCLAGKELKYGNEIIDTRKKAAMAGTVLRS